MQNPNISTDALQLFQAIIRTKSLTQGAELTGMSIGTASRTVSKLREIFHDDLFIRTNYGMIPTRRAEEIAPGIQRMLDSYDAIFMQNTFDPSTINRSFRIACVDNAIFTFLAPALDPLLRLAPNIVVDFVPLPARFEQGLRDGDFDFVVYPKVPDRDDLYAQKLMDDVFVLISGCQHPLNELRKNRPLVAKDFEPYRQFRITTIPVGPSDGTWADTPQTERVSDERIAVRSPYFVPVLELVTTTSLWGAIPLQMASHFVKLVPSLSILGRPESAETYKPQLLWHLRTHKDPASVWIRSVLLSSTKCYANIDEVPIIEGM